MRAGEVRRSRPGGRGGVALVRLGLLVALAVGSACPGRGGGSGGSGTGNFRRPNYPVASVYEIDPDFEGEWRGDVAGLRGTLVIGPLDDRNYYGSFTTLDSNTEYTMLIEQSYVSTPEDEAVASNRALFTWQDGLGSRGHGWLLINRDDTALTGSFGYSAATEGVGSWSFTRVEAPLE
ncbi:hypothetical protein [Plesiocystis pacifica]|uniref:hypothetical protein n=1 Tax=Plesiocystis pacifica TaxID=191768 RepID=UPI0012F9D5A3|nr:hypothetical protein [Plesiocystis pacifica]